jgi:hypothetical protein
VRGLTIELSTLISFIIGIGFGITLFSLIYLYFLVRSVRAPLHQKAKTLPPLTEDALNQILEDALVVFQSRQKETGFADAFFDTSKAMIQTIAKEYFPMSKHPLLELSIDELMMMAGYIQERVDNLLKKGVLKNARQIRLIKFMEMIELKRRLDENRWMQLMRSDALQKTVISTLHLVNLFNPVYWFRRIIIKTSVDVLNKRIGKTLLAVVAEESSRIYSKKAFDTALDYDLVTRALEKLELEDIDEID